MITPPLTLIRCLVITTCLLLAPFDRFHIKCQYILKTCQLFQNIREPYQLNGSTLTLLSYGHVDEEHDEKTGIMGPCLNFCLTTEASCGAVVSCYKQTTMDQA